MSQVIVPFLIPAMSTQFGLVRPLKLTLPISSDYLSTRRSASKQTKLASILKAIASFNISKRTSVQD